MKQVSAELAAAIESPDRTVRPVLRVDWDGDGTVYEPGEIRFVDDAAVDNATAGTSIVVPKPAATEQDAGHVLLAFINLVGTNAADELADLVDPDGFVGLGSSGNLATDILTAVYVNTNPGAETSYTWSFDTAHKNNGWIGCYSGVDLDDPVILTRILNAGAGTAFATPRVLVPKRAWLVSMAAGRYDTGAAASWTNGTGADAERHDFGSNTAGVDITVAVYDSNSGPAVGAEQDRTLTSSQTLLEALVRSVLLRPVAAVPLTPIRGDIDDLSPLVAEWARDQVAAGDLPEQVRLVEGSAVAQARVQLARGRVFDPAAACHPRYRVVDVSQGSANPSALTSIILPFDHQPGDLGLYVLGLTEPARSLAFDRPVDTALDASYASDLRLVVAKRFVVDSSAANVVATFGHDPLNDEAFFSTVGLAFGPASPHLPGVAGVHVVGATAATGADTVHATPEIETTVDGCRLVTIWAANVASGTWTTPDVPLSQTIGDDGATNVALAAAVSDPVPAGRYSRTATLSVSTDKVIAAIIAIGPVQATDERRHAAWYFSPLNTDSSVSRKLKTNRVATLDVEFQTETGPQTVRRLTGYTRELVADGGKRDVALTLLDNREKLRALVTLPPLEGAVQGANATWIITWALAVNGVAASPLPRNITTSLTEFDDGTAYEILSSDATVCLPMHGSLWPWFGNYFDGDGNPPDIQAVRNNGSGETPVVPTFVDGPYVLGAYAEVRSNVDYTKITGTLNGEAFGQLVSVGRDGLFEFWVRGDGIPASVPHDEIVLLQMDGADVPFHFTVGLWKDGRVFARLLDNVTQRFAVFGGTVPTDGQWHFCGIAWTFAGTPTVWFRVDDTETSTTVGLGGTDVSSGEAFSYPFRALLPVAEVQGSVAFLPFGAAGPTWLIDDFTPTAIVDPSRLDLVANPERTERETWDLLDELASSELALSYWEDDTYRYRSARRYLEPQLADEQTTLTADQAITAIDAKETVDTVRNIVDARWSETYIETDFAWSLGDPVLVPGFNSVPDVPVVLDSPVASFDGSIVLLSAAPGTTQSYFRANTAADGSGTPVTVNMTAFASLDTTGQGRVQFFNGNATAVYVVEARLAGRVIKTRTPASAPIRDLDSIDRHGKQPIQLATSQWVQTRDLALRLARQVLLDLRSPTVEITNLDVRGDPRLQMQDRVNVVDRDGLAVDSDWWITGVREGQTGDQRYAMALTLRQALPVLQWDTDPGWDDAMWAGGDVAWSDYTVVWSASSAPSLGNGTLVGKWQKVGDIAAFRMVLTAGSTTTFGSGAWAFSLPFTPAGDAAAVAFVVDSSAGTRYRGVAEITAAGGVALVAMADNTTGASATSPITFATGDKLVICGLAQAA